MTQNLLPSRPSSSPFVRRILNLALAFGGAVALLGTSLVVPATAEVSTPATPRITQRIDDSQRTVLHGNTLPIAKAKYDKGAVAAGTQADRMLLVLKRSDAQEQELKKLIADMHNPASPSFHKWLKPSEFGKRFGVADSDLETVKAWLQAKGFTITKTAQGKGLIEISGTAGQLKNAFHTELHQYQRKGVTFIANNKDPEIPTALAGVVKGFASLNNFDPKSDLKVLGTAQFDPKTQKVKPEWTYPLGEEGNYLVPAPADMAVQYNIPSTATGAGETIGILSASNVDVSIVQNYRSLFNIGTVTNVPQVIVDGTDPGQNGAAVEAYLDVEASASMAPGAAVNLYVGGGSITTSGLYNAIIRAIDDDVADVMSLSYGECEQAIGSSGNQFFYNEWEQAAAQGQSVFVSAGDGGSAGCDDFDSESEATQGLAVSGFSSTPYNTSVGGTDFYYSDYNNPNDLNTQLAQYWNLNPSNTPTVSILQTIPEQPWNNSLGLNAGGDGYGIVAGSGGASSCAFGSDDPVSGSYDTCSGGYPKPSWQTGVGVPDDGVRDIPDVSLFAANGVNYSFWPICAAGTDCVAAYGTPGGPVAITGVGGTSASSPATAGIMALVDQAQKGRQGNANFYLYAIAAQDPTAFNDVTAGSNNVICEPGSPNCSADTNDQYYSLQEYPATVGYDQASGLGTPNVAKLLADWGAVTFSGTTTTLALSTTTAVHGVPITATATVTGPAPANAKGTKKNTTASETGPSGSVALVTADANPNSKGQGTIPLTDGTGSGPVYLAGGTYSVTGVYSGDGIYGASDSSPVSVTITPEASKVSVQSELLDANGNFDTVTPGGSYPYGGEYAIDADIAGVSGFGTPSGQVTFYDGSTAIGTANADSSGLQSFGPTGSPVSGSTAELNISSLTPGTHTVSAKYAGDASFNPSSSAGVTFTITKGTPEVFSEDASFYGPVYSGQAFTVPVYVQGNYVPSGYIFAQPAAPTGSVTITLAGTTTGTTTTGPIALSAVDAFGANLGYGSYTFPSLAADTYTLSITYSGDSNYTTAVSNAESITVAGATTAPTTTTFTASTVNGSSVAANGAASVSITVAASGSLTTPAPTGYVLVYDNGVEIYYFPLDGVTDVVTGFIPSTYLFNGTNVLTAQYTGDSNYSASFSSPVTLTAASGDFSFTTSSSLLTIASGSTGSTTFTVQSLQGLTGTVNFTCTPSNPSLICTLAPASLPLTSDGVQQTTTVTIDTHDKSTGLVVQAKDKRSNAKHVGEWLAGGGIAMAMLFLGFPARRRSAWKLKGGMLFTLLLMAGLGLGISGCGGHANYYGTSNGSNVAPGTYTVNITATDAGVVHQATLTVVVQ